MPVKEYSLINDRKIESKIREHYDENFKMRNVSEFDKGYLQCLIDIKSGRYT